MVKRKVRIKNMKDVDTFNKLCSKFDCDMDLISGKYYVNAKSIMGIFSIDLSKPVNVRIQAEGEEAEKAEQVIKKFEVK